MLGAIIGDIVGSVFEWERIKHTDFPLFCERSAFTDDTVMTMATAQTLLDGAQGDHAANYRAFGRRYPRRGYGGMFAQWLASDTMGPYNSWGNGSAMRVSPVGFACTTVDTALNQAQRSAAVTHDHAEGIKGAQATALAVFLARTGARKDHGRDVRATKDEIRSEIAERFGYDLDRTIEQIRPAYGFRESCQATVPEAIIAFLDSTDFEHAIRLAVSLGGDSDTLACITGGIAQAYYKAIPQWIADEALNRLPAELTDLLDRFEKRFDVKR
ncbi:MAG: ADP-ribosylglycohydrolase family protein [Planctomycetaceae bacterium]|nr:ADP-ribosylglycohydrolase family protein [Planctomycetaceae bacterium]